MFMEYLKRFAVVLLTLVTGIGLGLFAALCAAVMSLGAITSDLWSWMMPHFRFVADLVTNDGLDPEDAGEIVITHNGTLWIARGEAIHGFDVVGKGRSPVKALADLLEEIRKIERNANIL